ncbi:hypothetical protein [Agarilytica rhodophyticola]|uniref:hypothetical protein n=1 Tax=Agarilytica rhodophyticola TaxID=1737490 RepID=UPI000B34945A|nr:hypothetical protein [Agarilytica rhodophyticola]
MKVKLPKTRTLLLDLSVILIYTFIFNENLEDLLRFILGDSYDASIEETGILILLIVVFVVGAAFIFFMFSFINLFRFFAQKIFGVNVGVDYVDLDLSKKIK